MTGPNGRGSARTSTQDGANVEREIGRGRRHRSRGVARLRRSPPGVARAQPHKVRATAAVRDSRRWWADPNGSAKCSISNPARSPESPEVRTGSHSRLRGIQSHLRQLLRPLPAPLLPRLRRVEEVDEPLPALPAHRGTTFSHPDTGPWQGCRPVPRWGQHRLEAPRLLISYRTIHEKSGQTSRLHKPNKPPAFRASPGPVTPSCANKGHRE